MSYKKLLKQQRGLSIIEIMVAFSILTIAFVGLTQAFPFGLSINKTAENSTIASYLAQDKIEELFSLAAICVNILEISADKCKLFVFTQIRLKKQDRYSLICIPERLGQSAIFLAKR